ncbi:MAG: hypothetical protein MJ025_01235 [Victivallaceae bacterium]|nr:hypothetical protein [Victivallaceae bacterium]
MSLFVRKLLSFLFEPFACAVVVSCVILALAGARRLGRWMVFALTVFAVMVGWRAMVGVVTTRYWASVLIPCAIVVALCADWAVRRLGHRKLVCAIVGIIVALNMAESLHVNRRSANFVDCIGMLPAASDGRVPVVPASEFYRIGFLRPDIAMSGVVRYDGNIIRDFSVRDSLLYFSGLLQGTSGVKYLLFQSRDGIGRCPADLPASLRDRLSLLYCGKIANSSRRSLYLFRMEEAGNAGRGEGGKALVSWDFESDAASGWLPEYAEKFARRGYGFYLKPHVYPRGVYCYYPDVMGESSSFNIEVVSGSGSVLAGAGSLVVEAFSRMYLMSPLLANGNMTLSFDAVSMDGRAGMDVMLFGYYDDRGGFRYMHLGRWNRVPGKPFHCVYRVAPEWLRGCDKVRVAIIPEHGKIMLDNVKICAGWL